MLAGQNLYIQTMPCIFINYSCWHWCITGGTCWGQRLSHFVWWVHHAELPDGDRRTGGSIHYIPPVKLQHAPFPGEPSHCHESIWDRDSRWALCSLGLVDVFLQENRGMTVINQECVRGRMHCVFRCLPTSTGKKTFVRFAKANYIASDYDKWTLNNIVIKGDIDKWWVRYMKLRHRFRPYTGHFLDIIWESILFNTLRASDAYMRR